MSTYRALVDDWVGSLIAGEGTEDDVFVLENANLYLSGEGLVYQGTVIVGHAEANGTLSEMTAGVLDEISGVYEDYRLVLCYPNDVKLAYPSLVRHIVGDWDCLTIALMDGKNHRVVIKCEGDE